MNIDYTSRFLRQYKKLPADLQQEAKEVIRQLKINPNASVLKTHKLKGTFEGFWSCSINYKYRIIFMYDTKDSIALLKIGDHAIYK